MRTTLAVACLCSLMLAVPGVAGATTWRGKTRQDRAVMVRTGADDLVKRVRISWGARCQKKGRYTSTTLFVRPFDAASTTAFEDAGTYHARVPGGYRARHTVSVSAVLDGGVWRGSFRVRTRVTRNGRFIDSCRLKRVRWSAREA
jgi:hypothetical protein